jgi:thioredoxin reductase
MQHYTYVVLGAGPAGLQMAWFLKRKGCDYVVLERAAAPGSFFTQFPRHRKLISTNKCFTGFSDPELNLRWDWNSLLSDRRDLAFPLYSQRYFPAADDYVRYLGDFARESAISIRFGANITSISRTNEFVLEDDEGQKYTCDRLIVATGLSSQNTISCDGAEHIEYYATVPTDPDLFRNQRVLIIGKGNSAMETADNLIETTAALHLLSPSPVRMAWRTHYVGDVRAVNNNVLDTYQLKSQNTILDAKILGITRHVDCFRVDFRYTHANSEQRTIEVDRIIGCNGFRFDAAPFDETCRPCLVRNDKYPDQTAAWESTNVPGLYFAGTLMHMRDYRKTFSGFIHGFRYNIRSLTDLLLHRYHGVPWPTRSVDVSPKNMLELIMRRVHSSSGLFQQPGFLADIVYCDGGTSGFVEEIPVDLLDELGLSSAEWLLRLTMEYGHEDYPDPFNIERTPWDGERSHFIHPVVRIFSRERLLEEYHVPEDLENNWNKPVFRAPLQAFLESEIPAHIVHLSSVP